MQGSARKAALASLCLMALVPQQTWADPQLQAYFTDFEDVNPNTAIGEIIQVGVPPETAELGGDAFGGVVGLGQLYHSGLRAWMVVQSGVGFIDFQPEAGVVEFFATAHSAADGTTVITAFDANDAVVGTPVTLTPGTGFQLVSFTGAIASIEVINNATNQMNGIDDFGFTPVPEPGLAYMLYTGVTGVAWLARRRLGRM
jgi:hypothetical protein